MRLHQAFSDALPQQKLISPAAHWSSLNSPAAQVINLLSDTQVGSVSGNKNSGPLTKIETYYFPIHLNHKKNFKVQGHFNIDAKGELVADWLECCNILLGHMLTTVEEYSYLHGPRYLTLDIYSPIKEVSISMKAAHSYELGRRVLHFKDCDIITDFSFWEVGFEKVTYYSNVRSVYDLDNR